MEIYWLIIIVFENRAFGNENYGAFFQGIHNVATQMDPSIFFTPGFANDGNINIGNDTNAVIPFETPSTQTARVKRSYNDAIRTEDTVTASPEACITNLLVITLSVYYFDLYLYWQRQENQTRKTDKHNQEKKEKMNQIFICNTSMVYEESLNIKIFNEHFMNYQHKYQLQQDSDNWHVYHNFKQLKHQINQLLKVVVVLIQQILEIIVIWKQILSNEKLQYLFEKIIM